MVVEAGVELGGLCYIRRPKEKATMTLRRRGKNRFVRIVARGSANLRIESSPTTLFLLNDLPRLSYKFGR